MTRRFEFIDEKSRKFWEIVLDGAEVTIRFGRVGTAGQTSKKSFSTTDEARRHHDKMVGEKVAITGFGVCCEIVKTCGVGSRTYPAGAAVSVTE